MTSNVEDISTRPSMATTKRNGRSPSSNGPRSSQPKAISEDELRMATSSNMNEELLPAYSKDPETHRGEVDSSIIKPIFAIWIA
jgi:hypothetical protein